jgi:hypothetical protein
VKRKVDATDPFVVGFVDVFVDDGDMQSSVDPVYAVISEEEKAAE